MPDPAEHPRLHKRRTLLAWPEPDPRDPGRFQGPKTARQLFQELDTDGDGFVGLGDVAREWPRVPGVQAAQIEEVLAKLAHTAGLAGKLSWMEFRAAVRLCHATNGLPAELRPYVLQAVTAASASVVTTLMAMQGADLACAAAGETAWSQLAAFGSIGAFISLVCLDVSNIRPLLQPRRAESEMPLLLGAKSRRVLLMAASVSGGFLLAPVVPLLASTIGDPQTKGYGPLAVAALAVVHLGGQALALATRPAKWLSAAVATPAAVSLGGGVAAAAIGVGVSSLAGRGGARQPILMSTGLLSVHSAVTTAIALRCHSRGELDPLQPAFAPALRALAFMQKLFPRVDWG